MSTSAAPWDGNDGWPLPGSTDGVPRQRWVEDAGGVAAVPPEAPAWWAEDEQLVEFFASGEPVDEVELDAPWVPGWDAQDEELERRLADRLAEVQDTQRRLGAAHADQLEAVAGFCQAVTVKARVQLSRGPQGSGRRSEHDVAETAVVAELQAALSISAGPAGRLADLSQALTERLRATLAALRAGRLDMARAAIVAEATADLSRTKARQVEDELLALLGDHPSDGPSPRSWAARAARAAMRADPDAARRRAEQAREQRAVRAWAEPDGVGVLQWRDLFEEIAFAEQVITDLAHARPDHDEHGRKLTLDQRRATALAELFQAVRDGGPLPHPAARRVHDLALVLPADTFFGPDPDDADPGAVDPNDANPDDVSPDDADPDDISPNDAGHEDGAGEAGAAPAAAGQVPGWLRGLGVGQGVDAVTAREVAAGLLARGGHIWALITDADGVVQRALRLPPTPKGGWTAAALAAAALAQLDPAEAALLHTGKPLPALQSPGYQPTAAITALVRARNPVCTAYDCPRAAVRCDLDHDRPWPRGPTSSDNLCPRCRRHHEHKTRRLVRTKLHRDGSVSHRMLSGLTITTRPEPLPGFGPGER